MDWTIAIIISAIGFALVALRSTWLIDYAVLIFVLNRGLRRVIDYYINHDFNPLSPISLVTLAIGMAMTLRLIIEIPRLPAWAGRIFLCLFGAATYAFVVGFFHVQLAALYALGETLSALALMGYALLLNPSIRVRDRWVRSFAWGAIIASTYGWYQYLTIPPWDAFWLVKVGFVGYMGIPEPTKMTCFSTMAERGVLAGYLGFAVVPMIVSARWRTWLSWPAVLLVFSVILLTGSRGGLMIAITATTVFVLVNHGAGGWQMFLAIIIVGGTAWFGMDRLPNSDSIKERFGTLGKLEEDGSYEGRVDIMSGGIGASLRNPLGFGLGAVGLGTRVNSGGMQSSANFGDAGYFNVVLVYGLVGTALLVLGLYRGWKRLGLYYRVPELRSDHVLLARSLLVATLLCCWLGDVLTGFSIFWLALGCGLSVRREALEEARWQREQRMLEWQTTAI